MADASGAEISDYAVGGATTVDLAKVPVRSERKPFNTQPGEGYAPDGCRVTVC